jgi:hypothetical protein
LEAGALDAPVLRQANTPTAVALDPLRVSLTPRAQQTSRFSDSEDVSRMGVALQELAPHVRKSRDRVRDPALRVLDCVLSLNRRYDAFVVPRLNRFEWIHPNVRTVSDLKKTINQYGSDASFLAGALENRDAGRASTLAGVVNWLTEIAGQGDDDVQLANIQTWARRAKPQDYIAVRIRGFGLCGFQYMRMLFGANTAKPDVHVQRYVSSCVGHSVSDLQALELLERAVERFPISFLDQDSTIWERATRNR